MKENCKKKLFISGPITDTPFYWRQFEEARDFYETEGYAVMNPAELPVGMSNADYARICLSMIDSADEVAFLPGWHESIGAKLEHDYCYYIRKPVKLYKDDLGKHFLRAHGDESDSDDKEICIKIDASVLSALSDEERAELFKAVNNKLVDALGVAFDKACTYGLEPEENKRERIEKLYEDAAENMRKEKAKIDGAVSGKDPLLIWRTEADKNDAFYATLLYAVEQALENGYNADFSGDADGWHSVSLLAPQIACETDDNRCPGSNAKLY